MGWLSNLWAGWKQSSLYAYVDPVLFPVCLRDFPGLRRRLWLSRCFVWRKEDITACIWLRLGPSWKSFIVLALLHTAFPSSCIRWEAPAAQLDFAEVPACARRPLSWCWVTPGGSRARFGLVKTTALLYDWHNTLISPCCVLVLQYDYDW